MACSTGEKPWTRNLSRYPGLVKPWILEENLQLVLNQHSPGLYARYLSLHPQIRYSSHTSSRKLLFVTDRALVQKTKINQNKELRRLVPVNISIKKYIIFVVKLCRT